MIAVKVELHPIPPTMDLAGHSSAGSGSGSVNGTNNTNSSAKKVGKFFPQKLGVKSRWKKSSKESFGSANSDEEARGRALSKETTHDSSIASLSDTTSQPHHENEGASMEDVDYDPNASYEGDPGHIS